MNYKRDSFDHRVCDDLCQFILQYLTPKQKLKLECVSKQFQRTAFLSQRSLELNFNVFRNTEKLIQLIKKFPKLNQIIIKSIFKIPLEFFEVIIENCNNLTHIQFTISEIEKNVLDKLADRFGNQLISISSLDHSFSKEFPFSLTTNIEELTVSPFDSQLTQIEFKRLKSFRIYRFSDKDLDLFELFIENNAKTLKCLFIYLNHISDQSLKRLLDIITKAINLVFLSMNNWFVGNKFVNNWNKIAINCKQIETLRLNLKIENNSRINGEMFSIIKSFKQLKQLDLSLIDSKSDPTFYGLFQNNDFKGLEGLTHLSVKTNYHGDNDDSDEELLPDIEMDFPETTVFENS